MEYDTTNVVFNILGFTHLFVPLVFIVFRKNSDIFMSFSKISNLAKVSSFQHLSRSNSTYESWVQYDAESLYQK